MVETPKTTLDFSPRLLAEYPMWGHDYNRYNEWLKEIEKYCSLVNSTAHPSLEMMQNYFSSLLVLYINWRKLIANKPQTDKFDNMIERGKKFKRVWEGTQEIGNPISIKLTNDFVDLLNEFYKDLMEMKQLIGLGIPVRKNLSATERIKMGMRSPNTKNMILPDV